MSTGPGFACQFNSMDPEAEERHLKPKVVPTYMLYTN